MLVAVSACSRFQGTQRKQEEFFRAKVWPIFCARCMMCHNDQLNNAGISFMHRETVVKKVNDGVVVVPGQPDQSVLIHAIRSPRTLSL